MKALFTKTRNKVAGFLDTKAAMIISSCVLLPAAAIFLITQIAGYTNLRSLSSAQDNLVPELTEVLSPASPVTETPKPTAEPTKLIMSLTSTEQDLNVKIVNNDGKPLKNVIFAVAVTNPDGKNSYHRCENDGTCHIDGLDEGDYTVSVIKKTGYISPEPVTCSVKGEVKHEMIENIEEIVDIKDVSELSPSEVKTGGGSAPAEIEPEFLYSSDLVSTNVFSNEVPVLDYNGNPTYTYEFETGPNGCLLYSDTREESDVIPVDEGYGVYYGLRKIAVDPTSPDESAEASGQSAPAISFYTVTVDIINPDNTPVSMYAIKATPITQTNTAKLGWVTENGQTFYYEDEGVKAVGLKNIDGTLYYFNQHGVKARSVGIDVSSYNERINWQQVKAQGVDFAIIRVGGRGWSSGDIYDDSSFKRFLNGAKGAGIKVGVYFYSTAISNYEAVAEASVVLDRLGGVYLDYPVFIDVEYSNEYPYGRSDNLSADQRANIVHAFCETIESGGYSAGVYSGQNFFNLGSLYPSSVSGYTIWLASYTSNNKLPNFSSRYDIWQFTDRGIVNGIDGIVDMNVIF